MLLFLLLVCHSLTASSGKPVNPNGSDICESKECLETADHFRNSINFSADPCENFYDYACGTWKKNHPLPRDLDRLSQFQVVGQKLNENIRAILSSPISESDAEHLIKVKTFVGACMDLDSLDARGLTPLLDLVREYGGWPLVQETWDSSTFDLQSVIVNAHLNFGTGYLFDIRVQSDLKNASTRKIVLDQPEFFLPRDFLLGEEFKDKLESYRTFIKDVAMELRSVSGVPADEDNVNRQIQELIDFERNLANSSAADEDRQDTRKIYNLFQVQDFQELHKNGTITWIQVLNTIFGNYTTVSPSEEIIVAQPKYFEGLFSTLARTSAETVANYLQWRLVSTFTDDLSNKLRSISFDYRKATAGSLEPEPREKVCMSMDLGDPYYSLGFSVSAEYIKEYFLPEDKEILTEMVGYLRTAFQEFLEEATWMDPTTKAKALTKMKRMAQFVGYPSLVTDAARMVQFYADFHPEKNHHFENIQSLNKWSAAREFAKLRDPVSRTEMEAHAVFVNAFYAPELNSMNFPAGILMSPFYRRNGPVSVNFGGIGVVIGHELTHGFDTAGSQYDETGNAMDWWTPSCKEQFNAKAQCFKDQYSNFSTPAGNVNGVMTSGENIADNGGIRQAYKAYQNWIRDKNNNEPEPKLRGLEELSHDQLFFLGFANVWCQNISPEKAEQLLHTDVHSPADARATGTLQNSPSFAKAFKCPLGSRMNPREKCLLW